MDVSKSRIEIDPESMKPAETLVDATKIEIPVHYDGTQISTPDELKKQKSDLQQK